MTVVINSESLKPGETYPINDATIHSQGPDQGARVMWCAPHIFTLKIEPGKTVVFDSRGYYTTEANQSKLQNPPLFRVTGN